jgi:hypothetical protein
VTEPERCTCGCANTFSTKEADADLRSYRSKGANSSTQALVDALVAEGVAGVTLLDIGGGIGAIQLELLAAGAASAESVDATEAYVAVARAEAERRGYGDRTHALIGDFVALASEVPPADIVTLDKVVCCYSDMPALLGSAAAHARRAVGLVYPREAWWNRLAAKVFDIVGWVTRNPEPWYLHRTADIDGVLRAAGFQRRDIDRELIWQVALYVKA